jgi:hypothetical protein
MQLPEFTRSTTLRWTLLVAGIFAAFIIALLGFVYLKTKDDLTIRSDRLIASQIGVFADLLPERRLDAINEHLKQDPARVRLAGLFGSNGRRIAGNLESLPPDLKTDNAVQSAVVDRIDESGREKQAAFATQDGAGAAGRSAIDLRQNSQLVLPGERPAARPVRQFGSCRRWGCHGGTIRLRVSVRRNHVISVLRPEAKLFGLRCLMIIGTEGGLGTC